MIGSKVIDVIVPVYNQSKVIEGFLNSSLNIDEKYVNFILVNDGSTDDTWVKVSAFIEKHKKTNFHLMTKENGGVSSARNVGLRLANSEYIWFCDPDDMILSDLSDVLPILATETTTDVFVFSYETYYVNMNLVKVNDRNNEVLSGDDFLLNHNNLTNNYWYPASNGTLWDKIYKRNTILELYFDETMMCSEDFNFNLKVFKRSDRVMLLSNVLYKYCVYAGGTLSSTFNDKIFSDRILSERETIFFLKERKESVRYEVKKHILKNVHLLSLYSMDNLLTFYESEHYYFGEKIYPFSSLREVMFFVLSKIKLYAFSIKFYRKIKRYFRL